MHKPDHLFDPLDDELLYIPDSSVIDLLTPAIAYDAVSESLRCHARGDVDQPLKPYVRPQGRDGEEHGGRFIAMPAYVGPPIAVAGIKWIAGFPSNRQRGLPRASGVIILNSLETGRPFAVIECQTVSARRTAAVAAIAFDHLAPEVVSKVALLGAGPIAGAVVEALQTGGRPISQITVFDPCGERSRRLVRHRDGGAAVHLTVAYSPQECVAGAEVVITATTGAAGYLESQWIAPGGLIVALSLDDCTEELFLSADKVVVDDFDQCNREEKLLHRLVRSGRFRREQVYAQLGQLLVGDTAGRTSEDERIYVNPMGMAIEDLATAKAVYDSAVRAGRYHILPRRL